jgi:hypothetical protein
MSKIYDGRRSRKHKNPHIKNQLMENKNVLFLLLGIGLCCVTLLSAHKDEEEN